jgi:DNA-binding NarL/FixJ family response regulator
MEFGVLRELPRAPGRPVAPDQVRLRVMLSNRHLMLLEGLTAAVSAVDDIELVGATARAADVPGLAQRSDPDVAVLGLEEPADVELARQLRKDNPALAVIMLADATGSPARRALEFGCSVLITKGRSISDLVATIRSAGRGDLVFPLEIVAERLSWHGTVAKESLTSRELEILRLLADGSGTRQIAGSLTLSCHTVRNHINNVMAKLGVHSRLEAVVEGQRLGLLNGDQSLP